jgi:hypothetical protein
MYRRWLVVLGVAVLVPLFAAPPGRGQEAKEEEQRLLAKVQSLANAKKYGEAADVMKKVLKLAPNNDGYLALTSEMERQAGRFGDGLAHALQAIKVNDKAGAYYILAAANAYGDQDIEAARGYLQTVFKGGEGKFGSRAIQDGKKVEQLLVPRTFTLTWRLDPRRGRMLGGALQVPLPKTGLPYQSATWKLTGAKSYRVVKGEANDVLLVVPQPGTPFQLVNTITVTPYSYKKKLAASKTGPVPAAVRPYLGTSMGINPSSAKLAKVVSGLKGADNAETVRNILGWLHKNVDYKFDKKTIGELDFKNVDDLVERGHAECRGYTLLCTGLCRAAGVPARPVWGLAMLTPEQGGFASHNWVEVYINGVGWVPVDPQRPESFGLLPNNNLRLYMDMQKGPRTLEGLPIINLLAMNGGLLRYAESRSAE